MKPPDTHTRKIREIRIILPAGSKCGQCGNCRSAIRENQEG
jgi:bacterioferritin-associated ferredoxin